MIGHLSKRIAALVPLFVGITFMSFLVIHLAPGSPVDAQGALNPKVTAEAREKMMRLYGLDQPLIEQYASWLGRTLRFDFGVSFRDGEPVTEKIAATIPITLGINLLSLALIFLLGVPLGIYGAAQRDSTPDRLLTFGLFAGYSMPTFWLALLLVSLVGVDWRLLPVSGLHSLFYEELSGPAKIADLGAHLALPLLVSSVTGLAGISRYMRSGMIHVLGQNDIRRAKAKGLAKNRLLYGHAFKNALLPLITVTGLSIPGLLGGSVVFETVFSIPGMGRLFFDSVFARDYPVIMGILVLGALLTLLGNALADVAYGFADPRIRFQGSK